MTNIEKNLQVYDKIKANLAGVTEIPTFKALCEIIGEPVRNGANKEKWIEKVLNKYITYKKVGRKFTDIQIKDADEVKALELEELFQDRLPYAFCGFLDRYYSFTGQTHLFISNGSLGRALGLYNKYYLEILPDDFTNWGNLSKKADKLILSENNRRDYPNIGKLKKGIKENMQKQINGNFEFLNWVLSEEINKTYTGAEENKNLNTKNLFPTLNSTSIDDMIIAFTENNTELFDPFIESWQGAYQFLRHVPNSIKYKIDRTIERVKQYRLIQHLKRYVGVYENDKGYLDEILLSKEQISDYFLIIYKVIDKYYKGHVFENIEFVLSENPEWYSKNLSEALEKEMGLIRVYQTNEFVFNPYIIRNLGDFFKNNILKELNTDYVRKMLREISAEVRENLHNNYDKRLAKNSKLISELGQEYYDYLEAKTLSYNKSDFANSYKYTNEEYQTNLKLYDKIFEKSLKLTESDVYDLDDYKLFNFDTNLFRTLLDTFKNKMDITPELFETYYKKLSEEKNIPDDDMIDFYDER